MTFHREREHGSGQGAVTPVQKTVLKKKMPVERLDSCSGWTVCVPGPSPRKPVQLQAQRRVDFSHVMVVAGCSPPINDHPDTIQLPGSLQFLCCAILELWHVCCSGRVLAG